MEKFFFLETFGGWTKVGKMVRPNLKKFSFFNPSLPFLVLSGILNPIQVVLPLLHYLKLKAHHYLNK